MSSMLELQNVTKRFGGLCAVSTCSFAVEEGHAHGIIGPNGAGKTTLFNLITGVYRPTEGAIRFQGEPIAGWRPSAIARRGIGRTFQNIRLFKNLSALENVRIAYDSHLRYSRWEALLSAGRTDRAERKSIQACIGLLEAFGLSDHIYSTAGQLPYGSQRRLEIARAIALKPTLLLLDEPAAGLNSGEAAKLLEFLRWVRDEYRATLLLIEHHMHLVMGLCDQITVLDFGAVIAQGTPAEIRANPKVVEAYLGEEHHE